MNRAIIGLSTGLVFVAVVAYAQHRVNAGTSEALGVSIVVEPFAQVSYPIDTAFTITVPEDAADEIVPVHIPFAVRGNAVATVAVSPQDFLEVPGTGGNPKQYLGRAVTTDGEAIGYDIVVRIPVSEGETSLPESGEQQARLPGDTQTGTVPVEVDLPAIGQHAHGVIHIVARRAWIEAENSAPPGEYSSRVELLVSTNTAP